MLARKAAGLEYDGIVMVYCWVADSVVAVRVINTGDELRYFMEIVAL